MLDNLREQAKESAFFKEEEESPKPEPKQPWRRPRSSGPFLGLTPVQRFILALMLFLMTCVLGAFCLLVTERVVLPF
jgi:hypothetical protein